MAYFYKCKKKNYYDYGFFIGSTAGAVQQIAFIVQLD